MIAILGMFKMVPSWCYWLLALAALCLGCDLHGRHTVQARWDAAKRDQVAYVADVAVKQDQVLRQTVTQYVDRIKTVHVQGTTITKQVPIYVTPQNDALCTINNGFVRMWNAANTGVQLSDVPAGTDGSASGVKLSDVEIQHASESTYARSLEIQLTGLQDAITGVTTAGNGMAP